MQHTLCVIVSYYHVLSTRPDNKARHHYEVPPSKTTRQLQPFRYPVKRFSIMDFPDNASTASSSPESTVSNVTGTLSSVSLLHTNKEPKAITDLPSEMILRIFRHLDGPSEIIALNSTSRMYYWIWRMNAASISSAVLSRSINCYNSALEVFEVEERVKQIHCIILSQCAILKHVRAAQREAQDVVKRGRRNDRWHHISSDALYRAVLFRNGRLLSAAKDASHVLGLVENGVVYSGGTSLDSSDHEVPPSNQDIITAYHELIILIRLRSLKAMKDRLKTICKGKIQNMSYVATYLVCNCPDKDKILLSISRTVTLRAIPWSWVIDGWDLESRPRCHMIVSARRAFFAVADVIGETSIPNHLLENRSGCHGDCDEDVKSEEK